MSLKYKVVTSCLVTRSILLLQVQTINESVKTCPLVVNILLGFHLVRPRASLNMLFPDSVVFVSTLSVPCRNH